MPNEIGARGIYTPTPIEFTESWIPDKLQVRMKDLDRLCNLLGKWMYVFLGGRRGSGKTVLCQHIPLHFKTDYTLYVKCSGSYERSTRNALTLQGRCSITHDTDIPILLQKLNSSQLLIFDDIHLIYNYRRGLNFLKSIYDNNQTELRMIIASTMPFHIFQKECPEEIWSRFQWKPLILNPFDAKQIATILRQRAERVFKHVDEGAINLIAAKIARLADPRIGLRVLNYAYTVNSETLNMEITKESWEFEKHRYWKDDVLLTLPSHTALLFLLTAESVVLMNNEFKTTSGIVYEKYEMFCRNHNVSPLYQARLNYYFDELENMKLIKRETISHGRFGATSDITLLFDEPSVIVEAGKEIDWTEFLI